MSMQRHQIAAVNMMIRRMLILTQYSHPEPGAPQVRLRAMAKELRARGVEVTVLTGMPNYPLGRILSPGGRWSATGSARLKES
jgi:hypothetical protein